MHEIELKLLLSERAEKALRSSPVLKDLARGAPRRRLLRSIYYDTPDRALSQADMSLRIRKDGRRWLQTVKHGPKAISGGLSAPQEAESPAPRGEIDLDRVPDDALRQLVRDTLAGSEVAPLFETAITRTSLVLETERGAVELAIDKGEVIANGRRAPLVEAELELIEGDPAAIYDVARLLFRDVPFTFSELSKAGRGHALSEGRDAVPAAEPRKAKDAPLAAEDTVEEVALKVLRSCFAQIAANVAACRDCEDIEGPHQLRVGLRRLRSAFLLLRPALASPAMEEVSDRARDIGAVVGRLRDVDVLVEETVAPAAEAGEDVEGFRALLAALEERRKTVRAEVREALDAPDVSEFLLDLSRFVELRGWLRPHDHEQTQVLAAPIAELAPEALAKRWKAVTKKAKGIEKLSVEERHDLRKALKKLRYGVDFFGPLFPGKRVKPFLKRLKALQEAFGALNDVAAAESALTGVEAPARDDAAAQRAVGRVLGGRQRDSELAWTEAVVDWKALKDAKRFWE
jgi:triphosphatase